MTTDPLKQAHGLIQLVKNDIAQQDDALRAQWAIVLERVEQLIHQEMTRG